MGARTSDPAAVNETDGESTATAGVASINERSGVSRDDLFDVLSNHRRRYALHSLKQRDGAITVGDLAEAVAAWENDVPIADLTAAQRKRVYTALQQFHLPKMDTTGLVEFDEPRGTVTLTDAADSLDVYLDVVTEDDIPWSRYYLGLSVLGLAAVVGIWLTDFSPLPAMAWAVLVAGLFLVSSLAHAYTERNMRLGTDGPPPEFPEH